ncbi:MAG: HAMP domain-containing sensor histidine kinase, partial [Anaerolineae bacterium]
EDLRTLSLAEAGQLPLRMEAVDVPELLSDVRTSFSGQAEVAGLDLHIDIEEDVPAVVGDVERLEQVLSSLVANAIRHTPAGGSIVLQAEGMGRAVHIVVEDTGEGIPAQHLPHVFDRFWRGDKSRSRAGGAGSGLGLAIARQLVETRGGRTVVQSAVGEGTIFTIVLPGASSFG